MCGQSTHSQLPRRQLLVALVGFTAGCGGSQRPTDDPSPQPTDSAVSGTPAQSSETPGEPSEASPESSETPTDPSETPASGEQTSCDRGTPEPGLDLSVSNRRERSLAVCVTVAAAGPTGGPVVFERQTTLDPGESVELFDVFPREGSYRVTASLPDGTSERRTLDVTPASRRSVVQITVDDRIDIGTLLVHPTATATPCGG